MTEKEHSNKILKMLSSISIVIVMVFSMMAPAFASITPDSIEATLAPGESISETKTVDIPELPPKADVIFSFDLTGSMGPITATAKAKAVDIMNQLDITGVDINYGVISYMDYPKTYINYYNYSAQYGSNSTSCNDYAYALNLSITSNRTAVNDSINALVNGCGADGPQDYTRMMYESYADPAISWRPGAKKIIVNFGDNVPHDNNLYEGVPGYENMTWSTGGDPGRDEIALTADDLDLQTVLNAMDLNGVTLIESHTTNYSEDLWAHWTNITGGSIFITTSATLVDDVVNAVTDALTTPTVDNLHLEASPGYETWVSSPDSYSGPTGVSVDLNVTITVPNGTADGDYNFNITAVDDKGVSYGEQSVIIHVVSVITVAIDIKPGSYPNSINPKNQGKVPVAILTTDEFDAATVDPSTVLFGVNGTEAAPVHSALEDVDGDGDIDMILQFNTQDTGIVCGVTSAMLTGMTYDAHNIVGTDSVSTPACK